MPGRRALCSIAASAVLASLAPAPAHAQGAAPALRISGCDGLQHAELERLLRIELSRDEEASAELTIEVQCGGEWIRLTLQHTGESSYLDRLIPAPPADDPGRERIVALAISQMVIAWESGARAEPPEPTPSAASHSTRAPAEPPPAEPAPSREAAPEPAEAEQPPPPPPEPAPPPPPEAADRVRVAPWPSPTVWLRVNLRGAGLDARATTLPGLGAGLRFGLSAAVEAIAGVEVAHGGAERPSGEVGVTATALHGGLAYSPVRSDGLALQLGFELGIGYLRLSGDPRDDFAGDSVDGLTLELGLQAGPRIRLGDAVATLLARAGWLFGGAEGLVVQGRPVEPAGPWLATTLELSLDI